MHAAQKGAASPWTPSQSVNSSLQILSVNETLAHHRPLSFIQVTVLLRCKLIVVSWNHKEGRLVLPFHVQGAVLVDELSGMHKHACGPWGQWCDTSQCPEISSQWTFLLSVQDRGSSCLELK